jgi:hypothetical protein
VTTCPAVTVWPLGTRAVRLRCSLPAGHYGDHAAAEIEDVEVEGSC